MRTSDMIRKCYGSQIVRHCRTAVIATAILASYCQSAKAQAPYGPPGMPAPYTTNTPVQWGSIPQNYQPWPNISPFENAFQQHSNQNGLWFSDTKPFSQSGQGGSGSSFFFQMDYLKTKTRSESGLFGNGGAQSYYELVYDELVTASSQQLADDFAFFNYYDAVDANVTGDIQGSGMRITGGWFNADDSGFIGEVMWNADASAAFDARSESTTRSLFNDVPSLTGELDGFNNQFGRGINELDLLRTVLSEPDFPLTDIAPLDLDELVQRNLLNLRGLPVANGEFGGVTIPYDIRFDLRFSSEVLGTSLDFVMTPIVKTKGFMLRPVIGARYMYVDENLNFHGEDSGALYDGTTPAGDPVADLKLQSIPDGVDDDDDGIVDNGTIDEQVAFDIDSIALVGTDTDFSSIINTTVNSRAQSHLAGPEIGLRYDLGGSGLKLTGHSKVGLMMNREKLSLDGNNVGMGTRIEEGTYISPIAGGTRSELFSPTVDDPDANAFADQKAVTHVSPMFEQAFNAQIPIFEMVPVLNRMRAFDNAKLNLGYSITFIGELASTNNSILWQGNPQGGLFPEIDIDRKSFYTSNWSFGLQWDF